MEPSPLSADVLLNTAKRNWRKLLVYGVVGGIAAGVVTIVLPPVYQARATILLAPEEAANPMAVPILQQEAGPLDILKGIGQSRTAVTLVAKDLKTSVRDVETRLRYAPKPTDNQLEIVATAASRAEAVAMVSSGLKHMDALNRRLRMSKAGQSAVLLKSSVQRLERELKDAETLVVSYQARMKSAPQPGSEPAGSNYVKRYRDLTFELEQVRKQLESAKAGARTVASGGQELPTNIPIIEDWRGKVRDLEYQLNVAQIVRGSASPEVIRLTEQRDIAQEGLRKEIAKYYQSVQANLAPAVVELEAKRAVLEWQVGWAKQMADEAPKEGLALQRLMREVQIKTQLLSNVRAEYEKAALEAKTDEVHFSVLDAPALYPTNEPVNKRYIMYTALGGLLSAAAGLLLAARKS